MRGVRHPDHEATGRVIEYLQAQPVLRAGGRTNERFRLLDDSLREQLNEVFRQRIHRKIGLFVGYSRIRSSFVARPIQSPRGCNRLTT